MFSAEKNNRKGLMAIIPKTIHRREHEDREFTLRCFNPYITLRITNYLSVTSTIRNFR